MTSERKIINIVRFIYTCIHNPLQMIINILHLLFVDLAPRIMVAFAGPRGILDQRPLNSMRMARVYFQPG